MKKILRIEFLKNLEGEFMKKSIRGLNKNKKRIKNKLYKNIKYALLDLRKSIKNGWVIIDEVNL